MGFEVECSTEEKFQRIDLDEEGKVRTGATDFAVCNKHGEGGWKGEWILDMNCRKSKPCEEQPLDGDGPPKKKADGTSGCKGESCDGFKRLSTHKAYKKVGNNTCDCWKG